MTEIKQRPDQTDQEFWAEVDPYDDRLSRNLPRWGCLVILTVLLAIVVAAFWMLN
jgi:hypothetical protein